jgi:hypothetical protein
VGARPRRSPTVTDCASCANVAGANETLANRAPIDIMRAEVSMRALAAAFVLLVVVVGCGPSHSRTFNDGNNNGGPDACVGLQCQVVNCQAMGQAPTTITGFVYAPNGTLPLYGINVYVPNSDPGPMPSGLQCNQCTDALPGSPVGAPTQTKEDGSFTLTNMPSGSNIPLVITTGKWRRIINIASVAQCAPTTVGTADTTLPKSATDATPNTKMCGGKPCVDMPKIAITSGSADSLECLVRRLGIADSEITNDSGTGHVHLYNGNGVTQFDSGFMNGQGGASLASAMPFWGGNLPNTPDKLASYDIVILSCEGSQNAFPSKPQTAIGAMKTYADAGGRVFASHWHNIWIGGGFQTLGIPSANAAWAPIAQWGGGSPGPTDLIDETNNPKGMSFATWMMEPTVMGSTVRDQIGLVSGTEKSTATSVDNSKAERWTYVQGTQLPQNFQFTTPIEMPPNNRCGKVVFSDMHVSGGPTGSSYPSSCGATLTLSAQEKALAFMFFDIASCVSNIP